jgi:antibiotic biosynthesis monooxygenase (ABM) superfamily enzyme
MTSSFSADLARMSRRTRSKQVYAVTYPGHADQGTERESYGEAEQMALKLAEAKRLSGWYEESPQSGRATLVKSFRDSN